MPYTFERRKVNLLPHADKRIKLTPEDEAAIRELHAQGWAVRAIAREYKDRCSRRLIQFVLFPERREHAAELFRKRQKGGRYYKRKTHTKYMRAHRRRKAALLNRALREVTI